MRPSPTPSGRVRRRVLVAAGSIGGLALLTGTGATVAQRFTDVSESPFRADIEWITSTGIDPGAGKHEFQPETPVLRHELAAALYRFAGSPATVGARGVFTDVPADAQNRAEIEWLQAQGLEWGSAEGEFQPNAVATRGLLADYLHGLLEARLRRHGLRIDPEAADLFADVAADHPAAAQIRWIRASGITAGFPDATFRPDGDLLRQEMAVFIRGAALLADRAR
ncbi:S-layer homology domain-containing protein [Helcobacillus sp. ACRRO]|uniref:S-layer homology domain-containing protein n=1 Tax=Helcobacillus massiliensis TaxID=521392 RepID=UPI0021A55852|nr:MULTISPECIES: S-layer homology domain-containing protein [Helcobacillus]MCG7426909.1 S-layer homology domain-containing protein [Helcobacillus sp. ACRRO]MCT2036390.1 S-layer homology domain-containing protein [Helcobacillus massiliensis]MCT2331868.1 S-layer homology domain-containing protein [Helcobacillus massiliensis]